MAGPPPVGGLSVASWSEEEGEVRMDYMEVVLLGVGKDFLGVPKP